MDNNDGDVVFFSDPISEHLGQIPADCLDRLVNLMCIVANCSCWVLARAVQFLFTVVQAINCAVPQTENLSVIKCFLCVVNLSTLSNLYAVERQI